MLDYYPLIKAVHVGAAALSGTLFTLRGIARLAGAGWPLAAPVRYLSYAIDSVLLAAALALLALLPGAVFANHWLTSKLVLLVAYIALGIIALRRARCARMRITSFVLALLAFTLMVGIALAHHPLGWWRLLAG